MLKHSVKIGINSCLKIQQRSIAMRSPNVTILEKVVTPSFGADTIESGTILGFSFKKNDWIKDDDIVHIETDKVTIGVGFDKPGQVAKFIASVGDEVKEGDILFYFRPGEPSNESMYAKPISIEELYEIYYESQN